MKNVIFLQQKHARTQKILPGWGSRIIYFRATSYIGNDDRRSFVQQLRGGGVPRPFSIICIRASLGLYSTIQQCIVRPLLQKFHQFRIIITMITSKDVYYKYVRPCFQGILEDSPPPRNRCKTQDFMTKYGNARCLLQSTPFVLFLLSPWHGLSRVVRTKAVKRKVLLLIMSSTEKRMQETC